MRSNLVKIINKIIKINLYKIIDLIIRFKLF